MNIASVWESWYILPAFVWTFQLHSCDSQRTSAFVIGHYNSNNSVPVTARWYNSANLHVLDHVFLTFAIVCNQYQSALRASSTKVDWFLRPVHRTHDLWKCSRAFREEDNWYLQLVSFFLTPLLRMLILQLALQGVLTLRNAPEFAPGFTQILPQRRLSLACWLGLPLLVSA